MNLDEMKEFLKDCEYTDLLTCSIFLERNLDADSEILDIIVSRYEETYHKHKYELGHYLGLREIAIHENLSPQTIYRLACSPYEEVRKIALERL